MPRVYIVYYSMYGHVHKLAEHLKIGLEKVPYVEVKLFQVPETLPQTVLELMHAPPKPDIPTITPEILEEADGILFGLPTRFGMAPAQMKSFLDSTGQLWMHKKLTGKMAGTFFSSSSQSGGQETTALTFITQLAHHGMIFVPLGFVHPAQGDITEVVGGSAYGCGTVTGPTGARMPSEKELSIAEIQGQNFGLTVSQFVRGRLE